MQSRCARGHGVLPETEGVLMASTKGKKTAEEKERSRQEVIDGILAGMRDGLTCYKACEKMGVTQSAFLRWVDIDPALRELYTRAREDLVERIANEILEISDKDVEISGDGKKDWAAIQKHKLQVDTRKWLLSKLAPKRYGEKLEISGDQDSPLKIEKIERVIVDQATQKKEN